MTRRGFISGLVVVIAGLTALVVVLAQPGARHARHLSLRALPPLSPWPPCPSGRAASTSGMPPVAGLIENVPCLGNGQVAYDLRDDRGAPMDVLDPVADPAGGYLGVYHVLVGPPSAAGDGGFEIVLAHSDDLIHWRRLAVLDPGGASMPTLRAVGDGRGFLLAYEKDAGRGGVHVIRVSYFDTRPALLVGVPTASLDLPLRYSPSVNGTPSFRSIDWRGGLSNSIIDIGFHYLQVVTPGHAEDREASGLLRRFRHWRTYQNARVDGLLDQAGMVGGHGDQREFAFGGSSWRVYEASASPTGFAAWHVLLYQPAARRMYPLTFRTSAGTFAASFGNPVVNLLPAPDGHGSVLVVTAVVFASGPAAREAGELLFFRPVG